MPTSVCICTVVNSALYVCVRAVGLYTKVYTKLQRNTAVCALIQNLDKTHKITESTDICTMPNFVQVLEKCQRRFDMIRIMVHEFCRNWLRVDFDDRPFEELEGDFLAPSNVAARHRIKGKDGAFQKHARINSGVRS